MARTRSAVHVMELRDSSCSRQPRHCALHGLRDSFPVSESWVGTRSVSRAPGCAWPLETKRVHRGLSWPCCYRSAHSLAGAGLVTFGDNTLEERCGLQPHEPAVPPRSMKVKSYLYSLPLTGLASSGVLSSRELTEARAPGPAGLSPHTWLLGCLG